MKKNKGATTIVVICVMAVIMRKVKAGFMEKIVPSVNSL